MPSKMPKYIELYSTLRQDILRGMYPVDSFLPTENELAEQYGVSKTTIRHAVAMLRERGMVEVRQGSGTRILAPVQETVYSEKYNLPNYQTSVFVRYATSGSGEVNNTRPVVDVMHAPDQVAEALGVSRGASVYRLQQLQTVDGIPFGYRVDYVLESVAPGLSQSEEVTTDLYGFLFRNYGVQVVDFEEVVDTMLASFMEAQYLKTEVGAPLLVLRRVANGQSGPLEYCETIVRPDVFRLSVKSAYQKADSAEAYLQ